MLNGVLVIDKPQGPTSHDVVAVARRALMQRNMGHTGTLDPMATGVLVLALGEATKLVPYLTHTEKEYIATLKLGIETDTLDALGQVTRTDSSVVTVNSLLLEWIKERFRGRIRQLPPNYSAIKIAGIPAHKKARRGLEVKLEPRWVEVHELDFLSIRDQTIEFRVRCSKGFYVRAFGRDLAHALGTCGHLTALRRTRSGQFDLSNACEFEVLKKAALGPSNGLEILKARIVSLTEASACMLHVYVNNDGARYARHGRAVPLEMLQDHTHSLGPKDSPIALLDDENNLVAIARYDDERCLKIVRGFNT